MNPANHSLSVNQSLWKQLNSECFQGRAVYLAIVRLRRQFSPKLDNRLHGEMESTVTDCVNNIRIRFSPQEPQ